MGRTRPNAKKASVIAVKDVGSAPDTKALPSSPALLEKAQSLIVQCDYELAGLFIRRVLDREPNNAQAKEMLGVVQLEIGELELAKAVCYTALFKSCPN